MPEQFVDDLETLRVELVGVSPVIVIGFSFGGMIALKHALKYPGSVRGLALIGTPPSHHFEEDASPSFDAGRIWRRWRASPWRESGSESG